NFIINDIKSSFSRCMARQFLLPAGQTHRLMTEENPYGRLKGVRMDDRRESVWTDPSSHLESAQTHTGMAGLVEPRIGKSARAMAWRESCRVMNHPLKRFNLIFSMTLPKTIKNLHSGIMRR